MKSIKSKVIPFTLTAIILISCICIPSLAFYEDGVTRVNPRTSCTFLSTDQYTYTLNITSQSYGQWIFVAKNYNTTDNTVLFMISDSNPGANVSWTEMRGGAQGVSTTNAFDSNGTTMYYGVFSNITGNVTSIYVPNIDCQASPNSLQMCLDYFNTGTVYNLNYSLPAGNVAYIEIPSNFDGFNLTCKFPENSSIIGPPWWSITSRYGFVDALPTNETNFNSFTLIDWEKADSGNLFGLTQNAIFNPVGPFAQHKYLVIYNPLYYGGTDNGPYEWLDNPSINITCVAYSIKVYALNSSIGPGQSSGSAQVNTITEGYVKDGEIDENGNITWTEDGVDSTEPITGGSNTPGAAQTIYSFLENIANQLTGFFQGAIGAINTVVAAISNFVNSLKGLYMWLPSPVYNLLTSAIIIAITIGVIKVFI